MAEAPVGFKHDVPGRLPGERWHRAPGGFPYLVSDAGRIYSPRKGRMLVGGLTDGYRVVSFYRFGERRAWRVGPLVLTAFVGPCPPGHECRHENGDARDNRLENLSWSTPAENDLDKDVHGTRRAREDHPQARLTYGHASAIRRLLSSGAATEAEAAEWFGVSAYTIAAIRRGKRWNPAEPLASGRAPSRPIASPIR